MTVMPTHAELRIGTECILVEGRAAIVLALIARYAARLNEPIYGRLTVDFSIEQAQLKIEEAFPKVSTR